MMSKVDFYRRFFFAALLLSFATLSGCGGSGRLPLKGTVTFDGEPVEQGYVQFSPSPGTTGPTSGADIKEGTYEIPSDRGLPKGTYHVNIQAWKRQSEVSIDPVTGEKTEGGGLKQILPAKYNKDSKTTVDVGGDQTTYDFNLDP